MDEIIKKVNKFIEERDWDKFHSPANLAKSISIEAAELLECFQWDENGYDQASVEEELADVLIYCIQMADKLDVDIKTIIESKIKKNGEKYPIDKCQGVATKYSKL